MKITMHVPDASGIEEARAAVEAAMREGDDGEIIVAQPVPPSAVERQERRPAGGTPANMKE